MRLDVRPLEAVVKKLKGGLGRRCSAYIAKLRAWRWWTVMEVAGPRGIHREGLA
jgi:hypothetical protein